jgi:hypothetical protein
MPLSVDADENDRYEAEAVSDDSQLTISAPQAFVVETAPPNPITDGGAVVTGSDYVLTGTSDLDGGYIEIQEPSNGAYKLVQTAPSGNWSYDLPVAAAPGYLNGSNTFSPVVISAGVKTIGVSLVYTPHITPIPPRPAHRPRSPSRPAPRRRRSPLRARAGRLVRRLRSRETSMSPTRA